jgi:DNA-directed RNA polymerase III subunit RPC1
MVLQAVCKCCSRLLLPEAQIGAFRRALQGRRSERNSSKAELKAILAECKKAKMCPHCGASNGTVKKMPASFKVLHDPYSKRV